MLFAPQGEYIDVINNPTDLDLYANQITQSPCEPFSTNDSFIRNGVGFDASDFYTTNTDF